MLCQICAEIFKENFARANKDEAHNFYKMIEYVKCASFVLNNKNKLIFISKILYKEKSE